MYSTRILLIGLFLIGCLSPGVNAQTPEIIGNFGQVGFYAVQTVFEDDARFFYGIYNPSPSTWLSSVWVSDGTEQGFVKLADLNGNKAEGFLKLQNSNQVLFFVPDGNGGAALWASDGSINGTSAIGQISTYSTLNDYQTYDLNGKKYFWLEVAGQAKLWVTDGTAAGSMELGAYPGFGGKLHEIPGNNELFFLCTPVQGNLELWKTDGTLAGTAQVNALGSWNSFSYTEVKNGKAHYLFGGALWVSDGSSNGTVLIKNVPGHFLVLQSLENTSDLYFLIDSVGSPSCELWRTDGSVSGTQLVYDFNPIASSFLQSQFEGQYCWGFTMDNGAYNLYGMDNNSTIPILLGSLEGRGVDPYFNFPGKTENYFFTQDSLNQRVMWRTGKTAGSVEKIKEIHAYDIFNRLWVPSLGNRLFFLAGTIGSSARTLWSSQGESANTDSLKAFPNQSVKELHTITGNNLAYFLVVTFGTQRAELWQSGGDVPSTAVVKDFGPGAFGEATVHGSQGFYVVYNLGSATIWGSDGTTAGSYAILDSLNLARNWHHFEGQSSSDLYFTGLGASGNTYLYKMNSVVTESPEPTLEDGFVQLFPNPGNMLNVMLSGTHEAAIQLDVFTTTGKHVHQQQLSSGENRIDLPDLPAGLYLVQVASGEKRVVKRWVRN